MEQEPENEQGTRRAATESRFKPGDLIAGKYRVECEIGRGGMGLVLAAIHVELEQRVAVKILHAVAAENPDFVARFAREARSAAKIRSEHVARMIDVGTLEDGTAYFVMEHLEGEDLAEVLRRRGALPIPVAVDYLLQACQAVTAAHAAGIVHRDIKPANLFIARNPDRSTTLKVLDFGVAKVTGSSRAASAPQQEGSATRSGHILGSPMYMSPEQLRGAGRVDTRADIWALGVVLYELLTNQAPFWHSAVADILAAVMRDPAPPLLDTLPDAPEELERVIDRCLEKEPGQRYANVAALARALVPFGPPSAEEAVQRMERLLGGADVTMDVSDPAASSDPLPAGSAASDSGKQSPSGSRRQPSSGSRRALSSDSRDGISASQGAQGGARSLDRGRKLVMAGVLVALAMGVIAFFRGSSTPVTGAGPGATTTATAPAAVSAPAAPVATPTPSASAALPAEVALTIDGVPPGTKIFRGVLLVGTLPSVVHLPRGNEKVTLRFTADGYTSADVEVVPDADRLLTVSLVRAPVRTVKPQAPKGPKDLETF